MLDKNDKRLLSELQNNFPLTVRPYHSIAAFLKLSPDAVLRKIREYRDKGFIRYVGAVLDTKKMGMKSSLVAMAVPSDKIKPVSECINRYSEVTHNYLRDDEYNMWFTVSARTAARRACIIRRIKIETGISKCLDLPTVRTFKINARFCLDESVKFDASNLPGVLVKTRLRATNKVLAAVSRPLEIEARPFLPIAASLRTNEREVVSMIAVCKQRKLIRRFGAVLDHYKIGLKTNALVAWTVKKEDIKRAAVFMSNVPNVSHCYLRKPSCEWPYTLYTMIHAPDRKRCGAIITLISDGIGNTIIPARILFTIKELKKTRFNPERKQVCL